MRRQPTTRLIEAAAAELVARVDTDRAVRLLGVRAEMVPVVCERAQESVGDQATGTVVRWFHDLDARRLDGTQRSEEKENRW